jgi:HK97 family phage portal protein
MGKRNRRNLPAVVVKKQPKVLSGVDDSRQWHTIWAAGTPWDNGWFQKDIHYTADQVQANWVVFSCETLIAGDISKLAMGLVEKQSGVFQQVESMYDRLFRKPNGFQVWQQLMECWGLSKQSTGNTYVLMQRDRSTRVHALYVLDPSKVTPLIALDGSVYYRLQTDDLSGIPYAEVVVPASEIMHDRFNTLFHPLVGLSPLYASVLAASQGLTMQEQSTKFFGNGSRPGGLLSTPGILGSEEMKRYKAEWEANFAGVNAGRTAVLGNGLKYEAIRENAVDSELVAQMNMSAQMICSTFHVPAYKVGVGQTPTYQNAEILNQIYYDDCIQKLLEAIESLLDEGLGLDNVDGRHLRSQFQLDGLLRMDSRTLAETVSSLVKAGVMTPNEGRAKFNLGPVKGGEVPYLQQQNFGLPALADRDSSDPFKKPTKPTPAPAANDPSAEEDAAAKVAVIVSKRLRELAHVG